MYVDVWKKDDFCRPHYSLCELKASAISVADLCKNGFNVITSGLFGICICTIGGSIPWGLEYASPITFLFDIW